MFALKHLISTWTRQADRGDYVRRLLIIFVQIAIFASSAIAAFLLRFEFNIPRSEFHHLRAAILTWIVVKAVIFHVAGLNRGWWRFVSVHDIARLALANTLASGLGGVLIGLSNSGFPRSIYIIDLLICFLATSGIRVIVRVIIEMGIQIEQADSDKRLLIYGAGAAGQALLREIRSNPQLVYRIFGFLDDDIHMRGVSIQGIQVLGTGEDLAREVTRHQIDEVLIAMPSASGQQMTAILERCHQANVPCKTIPGLGDLVEGNGLATQIRDVAVEDLLGRKPVRLEEAQIRASCGDGIEWR